MFTPTAKQLKYEIVRRATAHSVKAPKSNYYTKERCQKWLLEHPVAHIVDVAFLIKEEVEYKALLEGTANTSKAHKSSNWVDYFPFLCLYHCLIDDKVKAAFLERNNLLNHQQLDAWNSDARPNTFEEEAAALFNNSAFVPTTLLLPTLHPDFADAVLLHLEDMPGTITPEEV
jgi:hypothetical protein